MRFHAIYGLLLVWFLSACEDVIDVDVPSEEPRLIVEGLIRVDTTKRFLPIKIKVTETNSFFEEVPITELERILILIQEEEDGIFSSAEDVILKELTPGTGIYEPDTIGVDERVPVSVIENDKLLFSLILEHKGKRYIAQTRYVPTVPIDEVEQGTGSLLDGDETEVKVTFTDDPEQDNYYLFDFDFNEFLVTKDEFYKGQQFTFSYFYDREFEFGQEIEISIMGSDQQFFNYMNLILEQTDQDFGFFETPRTTVRGNVFDITGLDNINILDNTDRPDDFPLGYFAIVQEFKETLVIQ